MNIFKKVKDFFVKKKINAKEKFQAEPGPGLKRRIVSGIMAAAFALTSVGSTEIPVSAANGYTLSWETLKYSPIDQRYLNAYHFYGMNALGTGADTLFCLEWYQDALDGATYPVKSSVKVNGRYVTQADMEAMGMIQLYGYPYNDDSEASYIATQILIWEYFERERSSPANGFITYGGEVRSTYMANKILSGEVKTQYQNIIRQIQDFHYLEADYDKGVYTMTWNASKNRYEAHVYDGNGLIEKSNLKNVLENNGYTVEISDAYNATVSAAEAKEGTYIINKVFPNAISTKSFIGLDGHSAYYSGRDIDGNYQTTSNSQSFGFSSYYDDVEWQIAFKTESKPSLTVYKQFYEANGLRIQSNSQLQSLAEEAEFKLKISNQYILATGSAGNYSYTGTTSSQDDATAFKLDSSNIAFTIMNIPAGSYTLLESKTPAGFETISNENFSIGNKDANKALTIKNMKDVEESDTIEKTINKEWYLYDKTKFATNPKTEERITTKYLYNNATEDMKAEMKNVYFKAYVLEEGASSYSGKKYWLKLDRTNTSTNSWVLQNTTEKNDFTYATANSFTDEENATKMYIDDYFINTELGGSVSVSMPDRIINSDNSTVKFGSEIHFVERGIDDGLWSYISSNSNNSTFVNIQRYFKFSIYKIDSEGNMNYNRTPVSGARYGLYDSKLGLLETTTSTASGYIAFNSKLTFDLENPHRYYIKELSAPDGYVLDTAKYYIWDGGFEAVAQAVRDTMAERESSNGFMNNYSMSSSITSVYNSQFSATPNHSIIAGLASDEDGFHAVISETGKLTNYIAEQPTKGKIEIKKHDEFANPIKGVTFELKVGSKDITREAYSKGEEVVVYNGVQLKANTIITSVQTNTDGKAVFENLPLGEYVLYETAPAAGDAYVMTNEQFVIELKANGNEPIVTASKEIINKSQKVKLTIEKVDPDGKLIANNPAEFKIIAAEDFYFNGKLIQKKGDVVIASMKTNNDSCAYSWYTKGTMTVHEPLYAGAVYQIVEVTPPVGYKINTEIPTFTVPATSEMNIEYISTTQRVKDEKETGISFSKKQLNSSTELSGAKLAVYKAEDFDKSTNTAKAGATAVDTWESNATAHVIPAIKEGNYVFVETAAPDGYLISTAISFSIDSQGNATSEDVQISTAANIPLITMYDDYTVVKISKLDITGKPEVEGAKLAVYNADSEDKPIGEAIETWTSEKNTSHDIIAKLVPGRRYVLREIITPAGYAKASDVPFTVTADCKSTAPQTVNMTDDFTRVYISKKEINGTEELKGATLTLYEADGDNKRTGSALETWVSSENGAHLIEYKLIEGKTYVIHEESAPDGYVIAEDLSFTVTGTSVHPQTETMYDDYTKVKINKVEAGTVTSASSGKVVTGAKLQLLDADKNPVLDKDGNTIIWTSSETPKSFDKFLKVNTVYYVRELSAPKGYIKNPEDTKITIGNTAQEQGFNILNSPNELHVSKIDITNSQELAGAELKITDLNGNIAKTEDGQELKWTSAGSAKVWYKIAAGTYYLVETSSPDGYTISEQQQFTINENNKITTVTMEDNVSHMEINKTDGENQELLPGAVLQLTCVPNNPSMTLSDVIFTKPTGSETLEAAFAGKYTFGVNGLTVTWVSGDTDNAIFKKLPNGKYTITELEAPDGYTKLTTSIEFEIINGRAYNNGGKPYTLISIENSKSEFYVAKVNEEGIPVAGVKLQLWNEQGQMIREWTTTAKPEEFKGLPYGKYTIKEIAPADKTYNKADDMTFTHDSSHNSETYYMLNTHGFVMPETGGIGTEVFTIIGTIILLAGLAFSLKRRTENN